MDKITIYYTDKFDGKSSHSLLIHSAEIHTSFPADSFTVHRERGQKPYFVSHPDVLFSVSHSGTIWACAFAPRKVGLDVQIIDEKRGSVKLAERFFHPGEADEVLRADNKASAFTRIWSRKEALVKWLGIGVNGFFMSFDSRNDQVDSFGPPIRLGDIQLPIDAEHFAAIAYSSEFEVEIVKL